MRRILGSVGLTICLIACHPEEAPHASSSSPSATEPVIALEPPEGALYDLLDHPVAPYVMARGAGPSRISPDGQTIATRLSLTGTRQLYVMPSDGSGEPQQLTFGSGITFFEFSPTGAILFGADNNGDEREAYWLIEKHKDGGWGEPSIKLDATETGFRNFGDFTADGTTIVYSSTQRNGLDYDIYTADLESGEASLIFEGTYGNFVEAVSPSGATAIISESVGEDSDKLFILDLKTGERRVLSDPTPRANHTNAGVQYIGENDILFGSNRDRDFIEPITLSIDNPVFPSSVEDEVDLESVRLCGAFTVFTHQIDGVSFIFVRDRRNDNERFADIPDLPRGVLSIDCADNKLLVHVSAPDIVGDLYVVDLETGQPLQVFASDYDGLNADNLISPEPISLPARDGVDLFGLLYLPKGADNPPVVFHIHGGPTAQSRPSWDGAVQYLLSRGISVFEPNVRGSTGYGRTYVTLDDQDKRMESVRDLIDMLQWLEQDGRVDTSRAAIMGGSYGGFMVNAALAKYPEAFLAGVSQFGVSDWVSALENTSPALRASDRIEYGDITDPAWQAFYTAISPVNTAERIRVPVLYSHGVNDPRIDIAETERMVRALRQNGVRADYLRFPDEGHGLRRLSNRLWYEQTKVDFLIEMLKPR